VLVNGGYSDLTLRRVAAAAGMPLRHLQYYFPTKNDLLRSLCEDICGDYIAKCDALSSRKHATPRARFQTCIDFLIDDNRDPVSNTIFFELWALACHDDYANRMLDRLYLHYRGYISRLIANLRPRLTRSEVESRAVQIVALGMTVVILTGEVDVSVGATFGLCAVLFGLLAQAGIPVPLAAVGAILCG